MVDYGMDDYNFGFMEESLVAAVGVTGGNSRKWTVTSWLQTGTLRYINGYKTPGPYGI